MDQATRRTFGISSLRLLLAFGLVQQASRAGAVGGGLIRAARMDRRAAYAKYGRVTR